MRWARSLPLLAAAALVAAPPAQPRSTATRDGTWRVVAAESFAGYRVREKLAFLQVPSDAVGRTSVILGSARIQKGRVVATTIQADARTLKSDESRRDGVVQRKFEEAPTVSFRLTSPFALPKTAQGAQFSMRAPGILRLHGVARKVVFPLKARFTANRFEVVGSLRVAFSDYGIEGLQIGPVLSISDYAKIEVQLSFARV